MSGSGKGVEVVRIRTSLGLLVVVSHLSGVRAGQIFSQQKGQVGTEWYASCIDWYGAAVPPVESRVPEAGGCASPEEVEDLLVQEVAGQMKSEYWSDR